MTVRPSQDRLSEIATLMEIFRPERMVHISIAVISAVVLVGCAVYLIKEKEYVLAFGLFGSTGVITISTGRLLKMWNDVIRILYGKQVGSD